MTSPHSCVPDCWTSFWQQLNSLSTSEKYSWIKVIRQNNTPFPLASETGYTPLAVLTWFAPRLFCWWGKYNWLSIYNVKHFIVGNCLYKSVAVSVATGSVFTSCGCHEWSLLSLQPWGEARWTPGFSRPAHTRSAESAPSNHNNEVIWTETWAKTDKTVLILNGCRDNVNIKSIFEPLLPRSPDRPPPAEITSALDRLPSQDLNQSSSPIFLTRRQLTADWLV